MNKWTRWQDWVALVAGAYAALAPIWTETDTAATWTMVTLGTLTVLVSLWSLARPEDTASEYAHAVLGLLFVAAPWVMKFSDLSAMAYAAWGVGIITFVVGVWTSVQVRQLHHAPTH